MTVLITVQTVILAALAVLVAGLLRAYATVLQRLHALDGGRAVAAPPPFRTVAGVPPPGGQNLISPQMTPASTGNAGPGGAVGRQDWAPAHDLRGEGLDGEIVTVRTVAVEHDTVLVFLSSGCAGCTVFWEQLASGRVPFADDCRVLVVTKSPAEESLGVLRQLRPPGVDVVMSSAAWEDFGVPGSPYVIVVDGRSGRIKGEGSGTSLEQISGLMEQAYGDGADLPGRRRVIKPRSDVAREVDVDRALLAAGIGPGHPSLYGADLYGAEPGTDSGDLPIDMSRIPAERRLPTVASRAAADSRGDAAGAHGRENR